MSRYLFEHLEILRPRIAHAPALVIFINVEGTLMPIAETPEPAELPPAEKQTLRALSRMEGVEIVLFSARKLAELQKSVGLADVCYAGDNGLEIAMPECTFVEPAALELRTTLRDLAAELARKLQPVSGVRIDSKSLACSIHYGEAAESNWEEVRRIVHETLANSSHPFVLTPGEHSFEIRPRVYWNKGDAVRWIREQIEHQGALAIYVGENAADEEAFAALPDGITVRVGLIPDSAAQYHVNGPPEVQEFLGWLANTLVDKVHAGPRPASLVSGE